MRKLFTLSLIIFGIYHISYAQKKTKTQDKSPILIKFANGKTVSKADFEYIYQKNNGGWEKAKTHTQEQYREYLKLFITFRRKVMAAEDAGIDKTEGFQQEMQTYAKQLAQPYLVDRELLDKMIKEAYERSLQEVRASHLLIKITSENPADTLKAYQKIMAIRDSIVNKKIPFNEMAKKYSEDPSAAMNEGDLGYFTAFDMVYPFEEAAYNTPVGQVSMPVRTPFGYHLIWVQDKKKNEGIKRAAHIIVRYGEQYTAKDSIQALQRINQVYEALKKGESFEKLASVYSDDPMTAKKGGDLGTGFLLKEMQEVKHNLKNGEFSKPFKTAYGYHILKITDLTPIKTFEEAKNEIKNKVSRDGRAKLSEEKLIEKLKKQYQFTTNEKNLNDFYNALKEDYMVAAYKGDSLPKEMKEYILFSITNGKEKKDYKVLDFIVYLNSIRRIPRGDKIELAKAEMKQFINKTLLDYEETQLPIKYEDYRRLFQEYRDGILLFSLTEREVWRKSMEDTVGLKAFYEKNKDQFQWTKERVKFKEYRCKNKESLEFIENLIHSGKPINEIDSIAQATIKEGDFRMNESVFEKDASANIASLFQYKAGSTTPIREENGVFVLTYIVEFAQPGPKTYSEAKSECISKYQTELEKNWLDSLEKKYPYTLDEKVFQKLFK
ncbi:MAG: peptidyl-prolyl cis-trans isomerase [Bacteroidia bacterium]|nr:MAG: peptidyl-prolyl cis-trans isomerase [Bacteroidia bacterium]